MISDIIRPRGTRTQPGTIPQEKPLQSWKEIAAYLERDERTARRWEKEEGLPVRRHCEDKRSSVYAYPTELEAWRMAREPKTNQTHLWRWSVPVAIGVLGIVLGGWFILYGPVFNPPNPLVEAADRITFRQILAGPGAEVYGGTPSPDGQYFASADSDGDLALRDLESGEIRPLTNDSDKSYWFDFARDTIFSPDGLQLAYSWFNKDSFYELRTVRIDGTGQRTLYRSENQWSAMACDWSSDGKHILVHLLLGGSPRKNQLALVSVNDGSLQVLKTLDWRYPTNLSLSPNGRYVIYDFPVAEHPSNHDVFLLTVDGHQVTPLVEHPANDFVLGWVPDSQSVLFTSDRTGNWSMWMLTVDEAGQPQGPPELLKRDTGLVRPLGFTRDGILYYGIGAGLYDVYTAKVDFRSSTVLDPPKPAVHRFMGSNQGPSWSPDGSYLAYTSRQSPVSRTTLLHIRSEETGKERVLSPELTWFASLRWAPDGQTILARGIDFKGRRGDFQIDIQTGALSSALYESDIGRNRTVWTPDGKGVFYTSKDWEDNRSQLVMRDLETRQEKKIGPVMQDSILHTLRVSPDGNLLAACNRRPDEEIDLVVLPTGGGQLRHLLTIKAPEDIWDLRWTQDGEQLLFSRKIARKTEGEQSELWLISADGGEPRRLDVEARFIQHLSIHPDGKRIAFTRTNSDAKWEVWAMEGFLSKNETSD